MQSMFFLSWVIRTKTIPRRICRKRRERTGKTFGFRCAGASPALAVASLLHCVFVSSLFWSKAKMLTFFPFFFSSLLHLKQFSGGKRHGRTQSLKYVNGYAIVDLPGAAALEAMEPPTMPEHFEPDANVATEAGTEEGGIPMSKLPAWVAFDRKVCRFYAYFKEGVDAMQLVSCIL